MPIWWKKLTGNEKICPVCNMVLVESIQEASIKTNEAEELKEVVEEAGEHSGVHEIIDAEFDEDIVSNEALSGQPGEAEKNEVVTSDVVEEMAVAVVENPTVNEVEVVTKNVEQQESLKMEEEPFKKELIPTVPKKKMSTQTMIIIAAVSVLLIVIIGFLINKSVEDQKAKDLEIAEQKRIENE